MLVDDRFLWCRKKFYIEPQQNFRVRTISDNCVDGGVMCDEYSAKAKIDSADISFTQVASDSGG